MLLIVGTIRMAPEKLGEARMTMERMIFASRAETGCIAYAYAEDVLDAGLIHVKEAWKDRTSLEHHFASAHILEWRSTWAKLGIGERHLELYEVGEPQTI
jgi:quinol monooxygenase YgiN